MPPVGLLPWLCRKRGDGGASDRGLGPGPCILRWGGGGCGADVDAWVGFSDVEGDSEGEEEEDDELDMW